MAKLRQTTAFGPGVYRGIPFTAERLRRFVEGTNKAIQAGIKIPLLTKHAPINASDKDTEQFSSVEGRGWVTKLFQDDKGALGWEADNVPEDFVKAVDTGTVKLTSPEFREAYKSEKAGVYEGPVVRHMAFTPLPGNPHQGPIETVALQELGVFQFSEADKEEEIVEAEVKDEQFAEAGKIHSALKAAGWKNGYKGQKKRYGIDQGNVYYHDKVKGSMSVHEQSGSWTHDDDEAGKEIGSGRRSHLEGYLKKLHGDSQHTETDPKKAKKGDFPEFTDDPAETTEAADLVVPEAPPPADPTAPGMNPDMPPQATDKSKLQAVIAGLAQKNVVVPSDWDPYADPARAVDLLMGCLNTSIKTEQATKAEEPEDDVESPPAEVAMPFSEGYGDVHQLLKGHGYKFNPHGGDDSIRRTYGHKDGHSVDVYPGGKWTHYHKNSKGEGKQGKGYEKLDEHIKAAHSSQHSELISQFSEEQLAALPANMRAVIEAAERERIESAKAKQFAEEQAAIAKAELAKTNAINEIKAKRLPPALRNQLVAAYEEGSIQFGEDGIEHPVYTASQVAEMFDKALPPEMRFAEEDVTKADEPNVQQYFEHGDIGKGHVTPERARQLVDESPLFKHMPSANTPKSVSRMVAEENERVPNNVMRS